MPMELIPQESNGDANETRDTLFLIGGAALMVFGAGLITQLVWRISCVHL